MNISFEFFIFQDFHEKRSPHLVPYNKVDDTIKKANRYYKIYTIGISIQSTLRNCI